MQRGGLCGPHALGATLSSVPRDVPPYVSQWGALEANAGRVLRGDDPSDLVDWRALGFTSAGEYVAWSDRACGIACLQSLLAAFALAVPTAARLAEELVEAGAYVVEADRVAGLVYEPCVAWLRRRFGVEARVHRVLPVDGLARIVASGELALASVAPGIRWPGRPPTRRGGHLVLVYGVGPAGLVFHNPSGLGPDAADGGEETARGAVLAPAAFDRFYARRAITVTPPGHLPARHPAPHPGPPRPGQPARG